MFPPVEDGVFQHNPEFAALYKTLTTAILNPDGSTKNDPAVKERKAVREALKEHRKEAAKHHLLIHTISTLSPESQETTTKPPPPLPILNRRAAAAARIQPPLPAPPPKKHTVSELPTPLLDLLLLLPPFLATPPLTPSLSPEATALLLNNPPFSDFPSLLPQLATLVSSALSSSAVHLARVANPATNPSFVHRAVPQLPTQVAYLAATIADRRTSLTKARLAAATALTGLLHAQAQALAHLLRALEAKHGPIARSLEFRATEVALTAQRQETEAQTALWLARRDLYTPEVTRALANYADHLRDAKARIGEAVRSLKGELEAYGVDLEEEGGSRDNSEDSSGRRPGKEKAMREMARVHKEMSRQVDEVRGDLERLGRA